MSSTQPRLWIINIVLPWGKFIIQPSVNSSATFIIGTLINVHSAPAFPAPYPASWNGSSFVLV